MTPEQIEDAIAEGRSRGYPCGEQDCGVWECEITEAAMAAGTGIDWRDLFARYADHVGECEGVDFLNRWLPSTRASDRVPITVEERAAIETLMAERGHPLT